LELAQLQVAFDYDAARRDAQMMAATIGLRV
jgi:hypothetical protein